MAVIKEDIAGGKNVIAFLDMIAYSELKGLIAISDRGYNVIVGSTLKKPILFSSYADHPRKVIQINAKLKSTAAGRYQLLSRYFDVYRKRLNLNDFSPLSQDLIAIQQIKERKAIPLIKAGKFEEAVAACSNIWASLPGNHYWQHTNDIAELKAAYIKAGGTVAAK